MDKLSAYEHIKANKDLKENIIDQAKFIYSKQYHDGHDWAVIISGGGTPQMVEAHVVVYTVRESLRKSVVVHSSGKTDDHEWAMEFLLSSLVGKVHEHLHPDEVKEESSG